MAFKTDLDELIEQGIDVNAVEYEEEPRKEVMTGTNHNTGSGDHC